MTDAEMPYPTYIVLTENEHEHHVFAVRKGSPWWRLIATFQYIGRAESYAEVENDISENTPVEDGNDRSDAWRPEPREPEPSSKIMDLFERELRLSYLVDQARLEGRAEGLRAGREETEKERSFPEMAEPVPPTPAPAAAESVVHIVDSPIPFIEVEAIAVAEPAGKPQEPPQAPEPPPRPSASPDASQAPSVREPWIGGEERPTSASRDAIGLVKEGIVARLPRMMKDNPYGVSTPDMQRQFSVPPHYVRTAIKELQEEGRILYEYGIDKLSKYVRPRGFVAPKPSSLPPKTPTAIVRKVTKEDEIREPCAVIAGALPGMMNDFHLGPTISDLETKFGGLRSHIEEAIGLLCRENKIDYCHLGKEMSIVPYGVKPSMLASKPVIPPDIALGVPAPGRSALDQRRGGDDRAH